MQATADLVYYRLDDREIIGPDNRDFAATAARILGDDSTPDWAVEVGAKVARESLDSDQAYHLDRFGWCPTLEESVPYIAGPTLNGTRYTEPIEALRHWLEIGGGIWHERFLREGDTYEVVVCPEVIEEWTCGKMSAKEVTREALIVLLRHVLVEGLVSKAAEVCEQNQEPDAARMLREIALKTGNLRGDEARERWADAMAPVVDVLMASWQD